MLLEGIFSGGSQSEAPSQSSSSGSTGTPQNDTSTGDNTAAAPADGSQSGTVETYTPEETDDGTYGPVPPAEASTDEPVDSPAEDDAPADAVVGEPPTSAEEEDEAGTEPVEDAPVDQAENSGSTNTPAASAGVRDFLTPLIANLDTIKQHSASNATDEASVSQRRAAANVHDQMIRRMLDQMSASGSATQLFKSDDKEQTQSLPARWYAEA